ncbi:putative lipid II flippase FtsW [Testudinibacter sp. TR-2022]|uniref:putative lipid II flippase FtsW n=1 Tax=Testudinibacter sp. TR-2022 TaxID=2585029 RepID=UPI001119FA37|nr:putative lipid II flippase FtsW [Testudinibacter sp. TR-2022]TNH03312.1 putative lipid II flippase FtsW [Pasteurellaceae bacterium Phil31]TNH08186.1 putative lipid II flippase FtsW [Testudinibacter sp. TR-2022]TNH11389.1 putative lipid II flippase FtsW [Testudinibacter sp. TR-2022]TNH13145.1 putative lipid II flippase FtsW [Testudinibacter sp. TR-2022]TNH17156.1 putative lipid II flippase FtsW [Testudinibacter sp. TR-2022]
MSIWGMFKSATDRWFRITPNNLLYDRTLFWLFLSLMTLGFIIITSASVAEGNRLYDDPFHFAIRDLMYVVLACLTAYIFIFVPVEKWQKWSPYLLMLALLLLILVLIPGIGRTVNGARRWIPLVLFNFQPAEFVKFALICYLSSYFVRRYEEVRVKHLSVVKPTLVLMLLSVFLLLQPDLGSSVVLAFIVFAMLFMVGAKIYQFIVLAVAGFFAIYLLILTSEYRLKRLTSYTDPFADPFGSGFQLSNSLIAFGRGEFWGTGLGNSIQKLEYLPEAHTDFIMAIVGEEFGLVGIICVVVLFTLLLIRILKIGKESLLLEQRFGGYFAFGVVAWFFFQGAFNLGMTMGILPTKGFTFPFVSYGGSSLIINALVVAILLRIDYENRLMRGHAHLRDD